MALAVRTQLLTGIFGSQGDFISYLMDSLKDTLMEPASFLQKSDYMLAGKLEAAIRASNAQYEDPQVTHLLLVNRLPSHPFLSLCASFEATA